MRLEVESREITLRQVDPEIITETGSLGRKETNVPTKRVGERKKIIWVKGNQAQGGIRPGETDTEQHYNIKTWQVKGISSQVSR